MGLPMMWWLDIALKIDDIWDYKKYGMASIEEGVPTISKGDYAQKIGMLTMGMKEYPELKPGEAYLKLIEGINKIYKEGQGKGSGDCNGCGGKPVK